MATHDGLLRRFQPALRYDSNEQFFADSAAQFTEAPGIELRRAPTAAGTSGAVIARSVPVAGEPKLTLSFLGPQTYANGAQVQRSDVIGIQGRDYRARYARLRRARPDLSNRIYGHAVEAGGRVWLQYWMWYFYNDYQLAFGFGTHEGDWEMIQLRMGAGGEPDVAVYAQHTSAQRRAWADVEKLASDRDRPVVYVARGSHGAYFDPGFHPTDAWYDIADGRRPAPSLALETVDDAAHAWLRWPGFWGDTAPGAGGVLESHSPTGPGARTAWRNPAGLLDRATAATAQTPPPAPVVRITRGRDNRLEIAYDFAHRHDPPRALVVTVNSRDEHGVPPMTHTFEGLAAARGTLSTDVVLDPARHYDIFTSAVAGDPPVPSASTLTELGPVVAEPKRPLWQRVTRFFAPVVAWLRGDR
ncbi:MAG: hypothetical protein QOD24_1995 [Solirubrobacteraceae bacterium]|nr:hypothetical protein [Solirubrobacteraceae bacterium]